MEDLASEGTMTMEVEKSEDASGSIDNTNGSNSEDDYLDDDCNDDDDDYYDYGDDDCMLQEEDDYSKLQAQFDNADLPPGVEVSLSWMDKPAPSETKPSATNPSSFVETKINASSESSSFSVLSATASSSVVTADVKVEDGIVQSSLSFKPFDVVEDFSDHHYSRTGFSDGPRPKNWAKRIQEEWKILEKNLPDTIFVRAYESRMELLRAVIIGPQGTPYHDGVFVFDCLFPDKYPDQPPMVYYYSGGLRLNPNLYECGKVCLSLLGTWSGQKKNENWIAGESTMLQVLVSIQALILNEEPYYNEPGYTNDSSKEARARSNKYSEDAFVLSLKTMIYTIRRPPKHFEEFCVGHFRERASDIMEACKAYTEGARVGSLVKGKKPKHIAEKCTSGFMASVGRMMNMLVATFTRNGSPECEKFRRIEG